MWFLKPRFVEGVCIDIHGCVEETYLLFRNLKANEEYNTVNDFYIFFIVGFA